MRNSGIIIVGLIAVAAIAVSATTALKPTYQPVNTAAVDAVACVDYNPPSTTDTVTYNGAQYDLIKEKAGISADKIAADMKKVGNVSGKDLYVVPGKNYFGQPLGDTFVYVDSGQKNSNGMEEFNVYIKDGAAIPDYVTNCTTKGGQKQTVDYWRTSQFPPAAFNAVDVTNGSVLTAPGYIYDDIKTTYNAVSQLQGVKSAGSLFVQSKNKSYNLMLHLGSVYLIDGNDAYEYIPTQSKVTFSSESKDNLQLKWFYLVDTPVYSWYTPDCKPAIYLYPTSSQKTNVKVTAEGPLTVTIPSYPADGWDVLADPDSTIHVGAQSFPYLYYEAKLPDSVVNVPSKGYVVAYTELQKLYSTLLPKLGLSTKEASDFESYWGKHLPYSPYYFIGVMPQQDLNNLEKLTINPAPDTTIRVRLYFEALKYPKAVTAPDLAAVPQRNGFTAVEWGGMVKMNPGSSFTCSQ